MNYILIFIIGALIGFFVAWVWFNNKEKEMKKEAGRVDNEVKQEREIWYGFSEFNEKMMAIKKERKGRIMDVLRNEAPSAQGSGVPKGRIRTNGVADLLDISRATAFRYLEELEKEGVIEQVGAHGKDVEYRAKRAI